MMQDASYIDQSHEKCAICYEVFDELSQNLLSMGLDIFQNRKKFHVRYVGLKFTNTATVQLQSPK